MVNILFYTLEDKYFFSNVYNAGKILDVIIVLSGGSIESHITGEPMLAHETPSRLLHAIQIFKKANSQYIVFSGKGGNKTSDAQVMAQVARRLGIPDLSMIIDYKSENTKEHAEELDKLFNDKEMTIGLVTSGYHMQRAEREFRKYFKNIIPLPSEYYYIPYRTSILTFFPNSQNLYKSSVAIREIIGNIWYKIRY